MSSHYYVYLYHITRMMNASSPRQKGAETLDEAEATNEDDEDKGDRINEEDEDKKSLYIVLHTTVTFSYINYKSVGYRRVVTWLQCRQHTPPA